MTAERDRGQLQLPLPRLRCIFRRSGERVLEGFVLDPDDLSRRFVVELLIDGHPAQIARADTYVQDLANDKVGDGRYGFGFTVSEQSIGDCIVFEARLANIGTSIGAPILSRSAQPSNVELSGPGEVQWLGGLRFRGWIADTVNDNAFVNAVLEGEIVATARVAGWSHTGTTRAVRAFDLNMPEQFADGRVHRVTIEAQGGQELPGSPIAFVAFADGLEQAIARLGRIDSERLRGERFDRLIPTSMPFVDYDRWTERFPVSTFPIDPLPIAIILVGGGEVDASIESLNRQVHPEWCVASLPPQSNQVGFDPGAAVQFLEDDADACDVVVFALAGTRFSSSALNRILYAFSKFPDASAAYGDIEIRGEDGTRWPMAFTAFDYERMLEQGYCAYLTAFRRSAVIAALGEGCSDLFRQFNMLFDTVGPAGPSIIHIPGALGAIPAIDVSSAQRALGGATAAHLRSRGITARVTPTRGGIFAAVQVRRVAGPAEVSIVIPTRNRVELLRACIESIRPAAAQLGAEILVIDNDTTDPDAQDYLAEIDGRLATVIGVEGPFNYARLNNVAADTAGGKVLCLLNNDVEALDDDWLEEMLSRIEEPEVGAVGAMLLWPSGVVQHGGVVLGSNFAAAHAFNDRIEDDPGYGDLLRVAHETSCVTAACLLVRQADYVRVGGMDERRFAVTFNDVDLCLKLRAAGKRIVFTPHARLLHLEFASRGSDDVPDRAGRSRRELANLRGRWTESLIADPYYNPMLSLDRFPYTALAWPPRAMEPRIVTRPAPVEVPPGI